MGQYWYAVNLTKKEFVHPHKLGTGLKLWEQLANHPGTGAALIILCAAMPEARGGGDFDLENNWHGPERKFPEHNSQPGPMPEDYSAIAKRTIGRWAGDEIALIGDYAEKDDIKGARADLVYKRCQDHGKEIYNDDPKDASYQVALQNFGSKHAGKYVHWVITKPAQYKDISDDVCRVIEHELGGKFSDGKGYRNFEFNEKKED